MNTFNYYCELYYRCDFNKYTMQFLKRIGPIRRKAKLNAEKTDIEGAFEMDEEGQNEDEIEEEGGFFMDIN